MKRLPFNCLSPLLSNVYLTPFVLAVRDAGVQITVYGDDFVVVTESAAKAQKAAGLVSRELAKLGLRISPQKRKIVDLRRGSIDFLGFTLRGGNVHPRKESLTKLFEELSKSGASDARKLELMGEFVRRHRICKQSKRLYRGLDRKWKAYLPASTTLVSLLQQLESKGFSRSLRSNTQASEAGEELTSGADNDH